MKIKGIILTILLTITMSCGKQFLEENPLSFMSPENTFIDEKGLQAVLDATLYGMWEQIDYDGSEQSFNQDMSDVSVIGLTDKNDALADLRRYFTPQSGVGSQNGGRFRNAYQTCYIQFKNVNTVIDYIDNVKWAKGQDDPVRNNLLGSAYFLRAFYYFQQTMEFGNCAFPLKVITTARQNFKAFTMQSIWNQMIVDLEWASHYVKPGKPLYKGQVPNAAVRILLAKYYMMNLKFADAETEMNTILNSGEYALVTNADVNAQTVLIGNNNHISNNTIIAGRSCNVPADAINYLHQNWNDNRVKNKEGIFVLVNAWGFQGNSVKGLAQIRTFGPCFDNANLGIKAPTGGNGMDFRQGISTMMMKWGRGQGFSRPTNYSQYEVWNFKGETDTVDYRHKTGNWFYMHFLIYDNPGLLGTSSYMKPIQLYKNSTLPYNQRIQPDNLLCLDTIRSWYGFPMYKLWANDYDKPQRQDGGQGNFYVYRLAEVYLLRAEARFWQNNFSGAADDINVIRKRANAKNMYTAGDVQTDGIGAILDERNRELIMEERRHDELVRISIILAKSGKTCYNGRTYTVVPGSDLEKHLSANSFYYDRMMEKNNFFKYNVPWVTYKDMKYTIDPKHIFWPIYEPYILGNTGNVLNQTTGYNGSEKNIEPLVHVVQPAGVPNTDPMEAIGESK